MSIRAAYSASNFSSALRKHLLLAPCAPFLSQMMQCRLVASGASPPPPSPRCAAAGPGRPRLALAALPAGALSSIPWRVHGDALHRLPWLSGTWSRPLAASAAEVGAAPVERDDEEEDDEGEGEDFPEENENPLMLSPEEEAARESMHSLRKEFAEMFSSMAEDNDISQEMWEEMEPYIEPYCAPAKAGKGSGKLLGPAKKIMKACLRGEVLDKAVGNLPRLGMGAVSVKYVQAREASIPCLWKGQANLKAAQHFIHAYVEGKMKAKPRLVKLSHMLFSTSVFSALPQDHAALALVMVKLIRLVYQGETDTPAFRELSEEAEKHGEKILFASEDKPRVVVDLLPENYQTLNRQMVRMMGALDRELELCNKDAAMVAKELQLCLSRDCPDLRLSTFGSQATGLALPGADLDMQILMTPEQYEDAGSYLQDVSRSIRRIKAVPPRSILELPRARTPIIKFVHYCGDWPVPVDIAFPHPSRNGQPATEWQQRMVEEQPLLRPMSLLLKVILKQNGLDDPSQGGLGGYSLVNMIAFYLRHGYNRAGTSSPTKSPGAELGARQLAEHVLGFLRLYGTEFPFQKWAICLQDEEKGMMDYRVGKKDRRNEEQLMADIGWLHSLRSFAELKEASEHRRPDRFAPLELHIRDPVSPGNDLGAPTFRISEVRDLFWTIRKRVGSNQQEDPEGLLSMIINYDSRTGLPLPSPPKWLEAAMYVAALQGEGAETVAMRGAGGEFPGAVRAAVAAAAGAVAAGAAAEVVPPEVVGAGCEQAVGPI
eukprot:CAMPEP_0117657214 /NCGR_PEP_ID=MMETSP0804-20121206/5212_1 /TAXON_ID=1074897 /ORGANISM="Tetraselmis astigmatica, Strain CCMP880" /LENGTH=770 /DNA_ID=CAMNT_0005463655 /DNA_START=345 /DNA_END=2658 /DNA_ORIENTATION=-